MKIHSALYSCHHCQFSSTKLKEFKEHKTCYESLESKLSIEVSTPNEEVPNREQELPSDDEKISCDDEKIPCDDEKIPCDDADLLCDDANQLSCDNCDYVTNREADLQTHRKGFIMQI